MGRRGKKRDDSLPPRDPLVVYNNRLAKVDLCDIWKGCAAFLVLGGPSLRDCPAEVFARRGVLSLGVNNVCGLVRTTAFVCSDPPEKFHHGIWFDPLVMKFVPRCKAGASRNGLRIKTDGVFSWSPITIRECPSVYFFDRAEDMTPENFLSHAAAYWGTNFKGNRKTGRPRLLFTPFLGLRILHYLGVREIYCVGLDFGMDENHKYAFEQGRDTAAMRANNMLYRTANAELAAIEPHLGKAGLRVYNVNPKSRCGVFPFVSFDTALQRISGAVPAEPFDLADWYETKGKVGDAREIMRQIAEEKKKQ